MTTAHPSFGASAQPSEDEDTAADESGRDAGDQDEHPFTGSEEENAEASKGTEAEQSGQGGGARESEARPKYSEVEDAAADAAAPDVAAEESGQQSGDEDEHPFTGLEEEASEAEKGTEAEQSGVAPGDPGDDESLSPSQSGETPKSLTLGTEEGPAGASDDFFRNCLDRLEQLEKDQLGTESVRLKITEEVLDLKHALRARRLNTEQQGDAHIWLRRACIAEGMTPPLYPRGTIRLQPTKTVFKVSGFVFFDVQRSIGLDPDFLFDPDLTQKEVADVQETDELRMDLRRTRVRLQSWTPTPLGQLHTHVSFDFSGGLASSLSSSYRPRLRRAFADLGGLLIGQTWTNFTGNFSPNTVDSSGPVGVVSFRQPQIRYTQPIGKAMRFIGSLERPLSNGFPGEKTAIPDIVGTFNLTTATTTANLSGIYRLLRYQLPDSEGRASAWGVAANVSQAFGGSMIQASFLFGDGIGRYVYAATGTADGGGVGDAWRNAVTQDLIPISLLGWSVTFQQEIGEYVVANAIISEMRAFKPELRFPSADKIERTIYGNVWVTPVDPVTIGLGYLWGWRELNDGDTRSGSRPELSVQVDF